MFASPVMIDRPRHKPVLEQRKETRYEIRARALVQVIGADNQDQVGMAFHVEVINVSTRGMRLSASEFSEFLDGGTFELWMGIDGYPATLYLKCQSTWVSWEENSEFHMGVEILDRFDTDVEAWRRIQA